VIVESHRKLTAKLQQLMKQQTKCSVHGHECHEGLFARSLYLGQRIPLAGVAHQNGTVRFGHDPQTSALDANCRAHEVDNLYVVDGSVFSSTPGDPGRCRRRGGAPACGTRSCSGRA
jgi:choline dehydrogenase-like flavoprotein